ncbi:MAG: EamA family transporter [Phocaeicola sp.]
MWLFYAFLSATLLGCYDVFKKKSLKGNAVLPVLFLNTLFSSLIFIPFIVLSAVQPQLFEQSLFYVAPVEWSVHRYIILKSMIVLSSWTLGYFSMKHLPLTIMGPINATRPVMVLMGALFIFGERLNLYQWVGVLLAMGSLYLLSRSGKREGIDFKQNRWIYFAMAASAFGAVSGLYDKHLMAPVAMGGLGLEPMVVQSYYNVYQFFLMSSVLALIWWPNRKKDNTFRWDWCIICISLFLSAADFAYFYALSFDDAMISIVSMVRRGSVIVSFLFGALLFREKNLKRKAFDLLLILIGMLFLYWGTVVKG